MNPSGAAVKAGWLLLAGPHLDHLGAPFPLVLLYVLVPLIVPYPYSTLPYVVMTSSCGASTKQLRGSPGP